MPIFFPTNAMLMVPRGLRATRRRAYMGCGWFYEINCRRALGHPAGPGCRPSNSPAPSWDRFRGDAPWELRESWVGLGRWDLAAGTMTDCRRSGFQRGAWAELSVFYCENLRNPR